MCNNEKCSKCKSSNSLFTLSFDVILRNISSYCTDDTLKYLPPRIKNELMKCLTKSNAFWTQSDFKHILRLLVHPKLEMIDLTFADIDDDVLQILSTCKGLKRVYLTNSTHHISKQELLNFLKGQNQMQLLQLRDFDIVDDSVLECISENCQKIESLDVKGCREITDEGLNFLSSLKCLMAVTLSKTKITNDGLINFIKGPSGRRLKELNLNNCVDISIIGLREVPRYCPNLEIFAFYNCSCSEDTLTQYLDQSYIKKLKQLTWTISW